MNDDLIVRYNYDSFVPEKFEPWLNFAQSPALGSRGPSFPLWHLNGEETTLHSILAQNSYTMVEFGSFT